MQEGAVISGSAGTYRFDQLESPDDDSVLEVPCAPSTKSRGVTQVANMCDGSFDNATAVQFT